MIAGAAILLGFILAVVAGSTGSLGAVAGGFIVLGALAVVVCVAAALWRRLRRGRRDWEHANAGANNGPGSSWMAVDQVAPLGAGEQGRMSAVDGRGQASLDS